jgi:hypothetical protein
MSPARATSSARPASTQTFDHGQRHSSSKNSSLVYHSSGDVRELGEPVRRTSTSELPDHLAFEAIEHQHGP